MVALSADHRQALHEGQVIPAHPLALTPDRKLDEQRQRALTRYYLAAGAGGIAVGVHTTQFEIRKPEHALLEPVLRLAAEVAEEAKRDPPFIMVAGVVGPTEQAIREANLARELGYHLGLLSMGGLDHLDEDQLLSRAAAVAERITVFGFYLQPAVGGRVLSYDFWRHFAEIPGVAAIKIAPFDRYRTLDVVRAVCASSRRDEIALYTGNDDNIVADLLTPFSFHVDGKEVRKYIVGGLLGQWAVWTKHAVELLERVKRVRRNPEPAAIMDLLQEGTSLTDANAAIFDATNEYRGCIPGIHEVLRGQGLLNGLWCLNPEEDLSRGQHEEISRVRTSYPELTDDRFVARGRDTWLAE